MVLSSSERLATVMLFLCSLTKNDQQLYLSSLVYMCSFTYMQANVFAIASTQFTLPPCKMQIQIMQDVDGIPQKFHFSFCQAGHLRIFKIEVLLNWRKTCMYKGIYMYGVHARLRVQVYREQSVSESSCSVLVEIWTAYIAKKSQSVKSQDAEALLCTQVVFLGYCDRLRLLDLATCTYLQSTAFLSKEDQENIQNDNVKLMSMSQVFEFCTFHNACGV